MNHETVPVNDYYTTSDLALATAISLCFPIDSIDRQNPRKVSFLFKREDQFEELLEAYWKRELKIEPQQYFNQLKAIKARLYSEK